LQEIVRPVWLRPLVLTLQLMTAAVLLAGVLGLIGAWGATAIDDRGRLGRWASRLFIVAMVLAIALPLILHAAAWEATAGKFGWMMLTQTGARGDGASFTGPFAGLIACAWVHGLAGAAMVALASRYGSRQVDPRVVDASRLDLTPLGQWWQVRMRAAAPWWITALVGTATLAVTEMTVVDLYGFRTIADEFYLLYAAQPSLGSVLMTCAAPLMIVGPAIVWWSISRRRVVRARSPRDRQFAPGDPPGHWLTMVAWLSAAFVAALVLMVPLLGLLAKLGHVVSFQGTKVITHWSLAACIERILQAPRLFADEYFWTAILGLVTALVATIIVWPLMSLIQSRERCERYLDAATIGLVVLPGSIVALAVVSVFQMPVPGFRFLYQQTIVPTVIALLARGLPVSYWILRAAYRGIETSVLESAALEMTWWKRIWSIDRPLLMPGLITSFWATAIVASGDVAASLPVLPPGVSTVGTRLFGLLHSGARYQEAALAIWYAIAVTAIAVLLPRTLQSRPSIRNR
jgi:iron(III) transport system permease protein